MEIKLNNTPFIVSTELSEEGVIHSSVEDLMKQTITCIIDTREAQVNHMLKKIGWMSPKEVDLVYRFVEKLYRNGNHELAYELEYLLPKGRR